MSDYKGWLCLSCYWKGDFSELLEKPNHYSCPVCEGLVQFVGDSDHE